MPPGKSTLEILIPFVCLIIALLYGTTYLPASTDKLDAAGFRLDQVFAHLGHITQSPHPVGSAAHREVRSYLQETLHKNDIRVEIQNASVRSTFRSAAVVGNVHNVIATVPATDVAVTDAALFVSHYDSAPNSYGAADNGAAVAILLELARWVDSLPVRKNNYIFLFSDAEEVGLLGTKAFLDEHPMSPNVKVAVNLEARGTSGASLMFETTDGNGRLLQFLRQVPSVSADSAMAGLYKLIPNKTEMNEIASRNIPGMNFAFIREGGNYHNNRDNLDVLSSKSVISHANNAVGLAEVLSTANLASLHSDIHPDYAYFSAPPIGLVTYPLTISILMSCLALGLAIFYVVRLKQDRQDSFLVVLRSGLWMLIAMVAAILPSTIVLLITKKHFPYLTLSGDAVYLFVPAAVITLLLFFWMVKKCFPLNRDHVVYGSFQLWVVLTLIITILLPAAVHHFYFPLFLASVIGNARLTWRKSFNSGYTYLLFIPAILLSAPLYRSLFDLLGIGAPVLLLLLLLLYFALLGSLLSEFPKVRPISFVAPIAICLVSGMLAALTLDFKRNNKELLLAHYTNVSNNQAGFIGKFSQHNELSALLGEYAAKGSEISLPGFDSKYAFFATPLPDYSEIILSRQTTPTGQILNFTLPVNAERMVLHFPVSIEVGSFDGQLLTLTECPTCVTRSVRIEGLDHKNLIVDLTGAQTVTSIDEMYEVRRLPFDMTARYKEQVLWQPNSHLMHEVHPNTSYIYQKIIL